MPTIVYYLKKNGINNIKITGHFKKDVNLVVDIQKQEPELVPIFNTIIHQITEEERNTIFDKWVKVIFVEKIDYQNVYKIIGIALSLLSVLLLITQMQRRNNKKLKRLINSTIEGVLLFRDGRCIDANKQALKLFGYETVNSIREKPILGFIAKDSKERVSALINEDQHKPYEAWMQRKDGSIFPGLSKGVFIDSRKRIRISTVIDLTKLKEVEKALKELNENLEDEIAYEVEKNREKDRHLFQQNRLAQLGEMLAMIAHQWRQPLNSLSLGNQMIVLKYQHGKLDGKTMDDFNQKSKKLIQHMSRTIDDFRDFFRSDKEKKEFCINEAIESALNIIGPMVTITNIEILFDSKKSYFVCGYPSEFSQAILNIINNAKDAFFEKEIEKKHIYISIEETKENIMITIEDNAGGIPEAIINKIFEPYFSTKGNKNGTGLGLYMTKKIIVDNMDADITVFNTKEGASFKIILPRLTRSLQCF